MQHSPHEMLTQQTHSIEMEQRTIKLDLPRHIWDTLQKHDGALEDAVAFAVQAYCSRAVPVPADLDFAALLPALANDFNNAKSWPELQGRLKLAGYLLRHGQNGLVICDAQTRQRICRLDQTGYTETDLCHRFGRAFPTPIQRWGIDAQLDTGHTTAEPKLDCEQTLRTATRIRCK